MTAAVRIALMLILITAGSVRAQTALGPCSYDQCALRIKSATLTAPPGLVRGMDDELLAKLGLFQQPVRPFMLRSDSAAAYALKYDNSYDTGGVLTIVGTVLSIAAPLFVDGTIRKIGWSAVGIGISVYGGVVTNRANDHLARAIWWHNRSLTRSGTNP